MLNKMTNFLDRHYLMFVYIAVCSIFVSPIRVYIPAFFVLTTISLYIYYKNYTSSNMELWQKLILAFIIWTLITISLSFVIYGFSPQVDLIIKIILNMGTLFSVSLVIPNKAKERNLRSLVTLLEVIIILNFLQIFTIYIQGNLFLNLLSGSLTQNSDSAYVVSQFFTLIGSTSKNIWSTKLVFIQLVYLYIITNSHYSGVKVKNILISLLGFITIILLLSRTGQVALLIAYLFLIVNFILKVDKKYRHIIIAIATILVLSFLAFFFNKLFHISFTKEDGGYMRLLLWREWFLGLINGNVIIGNGLGSSKILIKEVFSRTESNFHNVFLNISFELGIVGLAIYIGFLVNYFKEWFLKKQLFLLLGILILPMLAIFFLQYLGFDNDIVIYLILILLCRYTLQTERKNNKIYNLGGTNE